MSYAVSRLEVTSGVAEFTMTREARRNPMVPDLMADLTRLVEEVDGRDDIASLIITGGPGAFCAGGDMATLKKGYSEPAEGRTHMRHANVWLERLHRLEKPVIMAVDGAAYGGGLSLALAGDFILASPRASFSAVFGRIGLIPDLGSLYMLPRLVGLQRAKELVYTARRLGAEEGLAIGMVHSVHASEELMNAARTLARRFTFASRTAFGIAKTILNESLNSDFTTIEKLEISGQPLCLKSAYHADAVERFVTKQPALFDWDRLVAEMPAK
jgi:2-(1,2-epoxy-1,2-dihydrophenyl)acetyl-CoA isomerase